MDKLLGVVLSGGESKRMGYDKGLLPFQNDLWASHIAGKLKQLEIPVVISINLSQLEEYSKVFSIRELVIDKPMDVKGPLKGLLSVHQKFPDHDLLLLACDMIDMERDTLENLIFSYISASSYDYYVYLNGEQIEPLCAIYTSVALKKINEIMKSKDLLSFSLKGIISSGHLKINFPTNNISFKNYNRPNDLKIKNTI
ncbi:MAG TPA: molybdenum cofactor guanylyltransferase [Cytophagales bacterium]|nr:molybdenum cofactor guanylyltransferase [Cytophagales bacterium]